MLVLSRKIGERVLIGNGIVVTVLSVRGGQVRLGIEAPRAVPVWREEVLESGAGRAERGAAARRGNSPVALAAR